MKVKKNNVRIHKNPKTERIYKELSNVGDLLKVIESHGERTLFSYFTADHRLSDITYSEFSVMVKNAAAGLDALGLSGGKTAVIGETSPEWLCMYLAVLATGGVIIPMDRELTPSEIKKFLEWVDADAIAYSASLSGAVSEIRDAGIDMKRFIPFTGETSGDMNATSVPELIELGEENVKNGYDYPEISDRENELAEYLFTSGTTGSSKCVMLSQKNIFSVVTSACETVDFNPDDTVVSVLPIHHTYELACTLAEMDYGIHICINDSLSHVIKNFKLFKPTGLVLVPLFVYTMHKKIWSEARKSGRENQLKVGIIASGTMNSVGLDMRRRIFSDVLAAFGGRLEKIICGGAALDPLMIKAFEHFGISIYEGYGITECSPLAAVTPYYARKYGSVGQAVPCCELKIAQNDDSTVSGYPSGEILVKGDNVMLGYYDNEEANAAAFTEDGYFRTGDVGYLDDDGYLFITGRQKSVIVLENGKNVFPEEIEEYLSHIDQISESVVVGRSTDGNKIELTAVVYPNFDAFPKGTDDSTIRRTLEHSVAAMNRKLPSFKRVTRIEIRDVEFEKTNTKKIKRHLVK